MKKKLMFHVVNASVPEPITSLNEDGNSLYFLGVGVVAGNAEHCAENEKVIQDAEATAICIFIKAFIFWVYIVYIRHI